MTKTLLDCAHDATVLHGLLWALDHLGECEHAVDESARDAVMMVALKHARELARALGRRGLAP